MFHITYFTAPLNRDILRQSLPYRRLPDYARIELADCSSVPERNVLYAASADTAAEFLSGTEADFPVTIFIAGDSPRLDEFFCREQINLIVTSLPLTALFNQLNRLLSSMQQWELAIAQAVCQRLELSQLLALAGQWLKGHLLLLNSGFDLIGSCLHPDLSDDFAENAVKNNGISGSGVVFLQKMLEKQGNVPGRTVSCLIGESKNRCFLLPLTAADMSPACLLLIIPDDETDSSARDMLPRLGDAVLRLLKTSCAQPSDANVLSQLFEDYFRNGTLTPLSPVETQRRVAMLPVPVKRYMRCIIIRFQTPPAMPYDYVISQLSRLIPDCNAAVWQDKIILLHSTGSRAESIAKICDPARVNELLCQFHACAIFSAQTKFPDKIFTLYSLSDRLMSILLRMQIKSLPDHIFCYEDHLIYLAIDLCARQFQQLLHHTDIIYLADASVITLARYDREHNTDLTSLLYYYLSNGRNITKTARMMYMHRNTVLNKLNRIYDMLGLSMEDGQIQQRLLFSCQLVTYYQNYLSMELNL
ncbi:MAG: helix-turn-helix domain-containing protein [Eubacteriales bacterium]|nr:helix-turn-helix domain-containing protein [Eubacteriales bacterium]